MHSVIQTWVTNLFAGSLAWGPGRGPRFFSGLWCARHRQPSALAGHHQLVLTLHFGVHFLIAAALKVDFRRNESIVTTVLVVFTNTAEETSTTNQHSNKSFLFLTSALQLMRKTCKTASYTQRIRCGIRCVLRDDYSEKSE